MADVVSKRKANFSPAELNCLVEECVATIHTLYEPETSSDQFWSEISRKVNAVGGKRRTGEEVKKKWKDIKSQTKKKEQKRRRQLHETGGGPEGEGLKDWEEKILTVIPEQILAGIEGGIDLFGQKEVASVMNEIEKETVAGDTVETLLILHPSNVNIKTGQCSTGNDCPATAKKRISTKDLTEAQYNFFIEQAETQKIKRKKLLQEIKTLAAMEEFYIMQSKNLHINES